jgi:N-acetylmuramoyl-L-alanine amidase
LKNAVALQPRLLTQTRLTRLVRRDTVAKNHKGSGMQVTNHGLVMKGARSLVQPVKAVVFATWMLVLVGILWLPRATFGQELSAIARLDAAQSSFSDSNPDLAVDLALSQPVPWRVRVLADPPRLVMDFREVDFSGVASVPVETTRIKAVRAGIFRPGWSRLVLELDGPYLVSVAEMGTAGGKARVKVQIAPADPAAFAIKAALPEPAEWQLPEPAAPGPRPDSNSGPLVVVLDPGHGGIDPGAERQGQSEAKLMLGFARQLKELLLREGSFRVVMTRDDDVFVPLETRISIARAENADVLISLHADALAEGEAVGAVVYTLSDEASDEASAALAERHDRDDLLAGIDLAGQDDLVATVLMDMARTETAPRTERLSVALEEAMKSADLKMHRVPRQSAGFSVLKSPDIPSVLIELGFLSSARDLARLSDEKWRARMAEAIRDGIMIWAQEDQALQGLQRQ